MEHNAVTQRAQVMFTGAIVASGRYKIFTNVPYLFTNPIQRNLPGRCRVN